VLLIVSDATRRVALEAALTAVGCDVLSVGRIAEVERWPRGQVIIIERRFYSQLWLEVGAAHIVVIDDGQKSPLRHPRITTTPDFVTNSRVAALVLDVQRQLKDESEGRAVALTSDRSGH
jgi:hypothetical protein